MVLLVAGSLLTWAHNFIDHEVHTQLAAQQIYFPPKGSPETAAAPFAAMRKYAGQQLVTGQQAEAYADHFIAVHLQTVGGGKTYAPADRGLARRPEEHPAGRPVATVFNGETLRGLLLNAWTLRDDGRLAGIAAVFAFIGSGVLFVLSFLGFWHSRRASRGGASSASGSAAASDSAPAAVA